MTINNDIQLNNRQIYIDLLTQNSKKLDISFVSNLVDPHKGKNGLTFVYFDKHAELYDDGLLRVKKYIAGNGYLFNDYIKPENLIEVLWQQK